MSRTIVHTLSYNLVSETEEATRSLYELNYYKDFEHYIVDLGFPLLLGADVPEDIEQAKKENTKQLKELCATYGSKYVQLPNVGVSQNWTAVMKYVDLQDGDVLICADPDERPQDKNWVLAVADVLRYGNKIAWCSLLMDEQKPILPNCRKEEIIVNKIHAWQMNCLISWPQGGFNGKFLNQLGCIPVPTGAPVYGWLEQGCYDAMQANGWNWALLQDYKVEHTECSPLYREWKTKITSEVTKGQMSFDDFLKNYHELPNVNFK